ncbi:MFS transporter [Rhizobium sp.]|jgi:MFS family permease|uniref:MFS transporter n=1 Tax=Rhizobium sp. TaxID=391 RepID=UPI000E7E8C40|nr:MFS transporter [Rhizobium sp.]
MVEMQEVTDGDTSVFAKGQQNGRWGELFGGSYLITTLVLCMGVGLNAFNAFLVSTTLPSAVSEIGGAKLLPWASTLYLAASIVAGASAATIKSRFGSRMALIITSLIFFLGTVVAASATSMPGVIVGRVLQGLGEGVVASVCYMLIPETFPRRLIVKVFGLRSGIWAVAAFGGPALAGLATETLSWRAAFLVNLPIIALFLWATVFVKTPALIDEQKHTVPAGRLALLLFTFVLLLGANLQELSISRNAMIAIACAGLVVFAIIDKSSMQSILPRGAFSSPTPIGLGLWTVLLMPFAQASSGVYLVYSLQHLWQMGPTLAGAMGAITALSWSATAVGVANISNGRPQRALIVMGVIVEACGLAGVAYAIAHLSLPLLILSLVAIGSAFGLGWSFLNQTLMMASPEVERDKTSALLPTLQSAGYALGAAFAGLVANHAGFSQTATDAVVRSAVASSFGFGFIAILPAIATTAWMLVQLRKD